MADLIQSPFLRQQYNTTPGYNNPLFIGDIVAANQGLQTMLQALSGFDPTTDFGLLWGFAYSGGNYGPGFFYLNGAFYYQPTTFAEGLRLVPNVTGIMPYSYPDDNVSHNLYTVNNSETGTGAVQTPVFATGGDMSAYRYDNKTLKTPLYSWGSFIIVGSGGGAPAYGTDFSSAGGGVNTQFRKDTYGNVQLIVACDQATTTHTTIFQLPAGYRPSVAVYCTLSQGSYPVAGNPANTFNAVVDTSGVITVNANAGGGIGLIGSVVFPTA